MIPTCSDFTLSVIRSVPSGSPPPPPRFLSSVMSARFSAGTFRCHISLLRPAAGGLGGRCRRILESYQTNSGIFDSVPVQTLSMKKVSFPESPPVTTASPDRRRRLQNTLNSAAARICLSPQSPLFSLCRKGSQPLPVETFKVKVYNESFVFQDRAFRRNRKLSFTSCN